MGCTAVTFVFWVCTAAAFIHRVNGIQSIQKSILVAAGNKTDMEKFHIVDCFIDMVESGPVSEFLGVPTESTKTWPKLKFGWRIVVATIIGFIGSSCGMVGGVGGGGIFVPMLNLIMGFDTKSAVALSKCMIMGGSAASVWYNLTVRHPTKNVPIIDYDLALLFQPMLMLGITAGVTLSVIFPYWLITVLIIFLFLGTSSRSFYKGIRMWKNETNEKIEKQTLLLTVTGEAPVDEDYLALGSDQQESGTFATIRFNLRWKGLAVLMLGWIAFLVLQIFMNNSTVCGLEYWIVTTLQIPVACGSFAFKATDLYKKSKLKRERGYGDDVCGASIQWGILQILLCAFCGILGGMVGSLVGLGGGFIVGPLLLELGVIPQVASATATFVMMFSSSLSVVEFYYLHRFPVEYAVYLFSISVLAGFWGQYLVRKFLRSLGRTSIIVFILSGVIFASALITGTIGIERSVQMIKAHEYMGFLNLCEEY